MKEHEKDNDLYTSLKHCNAFLSREEDYREDVYTNVQTQESTMTQFQKEMSRDAFVHSSDIFKKAKQNLRVKGEL
ncbi:hypothetical protein WL555_03165 [Staphylococcus warneri]|uniref:Uncharacterized protein n=1 Tax=Staphylococcus warneri TaxID=1292 RepID=A0A364UTX6_STAWA|nr:MULTISPECIES: hypothetical protein [Staphylococcus]MBJ7883487.1 hypothetical protein [Bacillaceae bacterium HSR45]MCC8990003.1 hypothetical protein [Staphylococcus sp.]PAK73788.1 hypothetical protein B8W95_01390 [Staphylococcus pasteuri]POO68615.1 hypothetical protein C1T26_16065 [Bacillus amyloliquefaciens]COQ60768.1 Uncharacterised protein [Streptococcus pneumoniae]SKR87199.1 Uncharacterised protein [Mycobacteroides abscessus subsp. abscessus]